jgi:hypothetical protein
MNATRTSSSTVDAVRSAISDRSITKFRSLCAQHGDQIIPLIVRASRDQQTTFDSEISTASDGMFIERMMKTLAGIPSAIQHAKTLLAYPSWRGFSIHGTSGYVGNGKYAPHRMDMQDDSEALRWLRVAFFPTDADPDQMATLVTDSPTASLILPRMMRHADETGVERINALRLLHHVPIERVIRPGMAWMPSVHAPYMTHDMLRDWWDAVPAGKLISEWDGFPDTPYGLLADACAHGWMPSASHVAGWLSTLTEHVSPEHRPLLKRDLRAIEPLMTNALAEAIPPSKTWSIAAISGYPLDRTNPFVPTAWHDDPQYKVSREARLILMAYRYDDASDDASLMASLHAMHTKHDIDSVYRIFEGTKLFKMNNARDRRIATAICMHGMHAEASFEPLHTICREMNAVMPASKEQRDMSSGKRFFAMAVSHPQQFAACVDHCGLDGDMVVTMLASYAPEAPTHLIAMMSTHRDRIMRGVSSPSSWADVVPILSIPLSIPDHNAREHDVIKRASAHRVMDAAMHDERGFDAWMEQGCPQIDTIGNHPWFLTAMAHRLDAGLSIPRDHIRTIEKKPLVKPGPMMLSGDDIRAWMRRSFDDLDLLGQVRHGVIVPMAITDARASDLMRDRILSPDEIQAWRSKKSLRPPSLVCSRHVELWEAWRSREHTRSWHMDRMPMVNHLIDAWSRGAWTGDDTEVFQTALTAASMDPSMMPRCLAMCDIMDRDPSMIRNADGLKSTLEHHYISLWSLANPVIGICAWRMAKHVPGAGVTGFPWGCCTEDQRATVRDVMGQVMMSWPSHSHTAVKSMYHMPWLSVTELQHQESAWDILKDPHAMDRALAIGMDPVYLTAMAASHPEDGFDALEVIHRHCP